MALYELSIDAAPVREAEHLVSLEGRSFPTLVMRWESRLFGHTWTTTVVLDYLIALPPLMLGQATFNEVRIAAFVGGASTKFLYFGTEMNASVPRIGPEMENVISPPKLYQEFRLDEQSCPVPYLKLIQTTPRIYGPGPQDYYSPAIKVERYDGAAGPEHIADLFPTVVANLDCVKGSVLTDPAGGFWTGARFVGATSIAILRQGKVVGLHRRVGRADKDAVPPEVKRRDPKLDILKEWVAVDIGAASTVVALRGEATRAELVRIGATGAPAYSSDYENPSEVAFELLARTVKAWRERVILPMTRWDEVTVGHEARAGRKRTDALARAAATLTQLPLLRERIEQKESFRLRGHGDPETSEMLKRPAPPIIDEDGIGAHDPFDPIELYAYYIGLTVNHRSRGIHTRYAVTMPTGWSKERRASVTAAFRRGFFRSLPAGLLEYHDTEGLQVIDAGPAAIAFAAQAFRAFGIQPKSDSIPFCVVDAGASETGIVCGLLRPAKADERTDGGFERMIEHLEPQSIPWLGGERLLHRLAFRVYRASSAAADIPFEFAPGEEHPGPSDVLCNSPEARANTQILKDLLRPLLEGGTAKLPMTARFATPDGSPRDVALVIDREALTAAIDGFFDQGVEIVTSAILDALTKIGKEPDPFDGLRMLLGGRMTMHPGFVDRFTKALPPNVKIHRFVEPEKNNLAAPTVKTACALGVLSMRLDKIGAVPRMEQRDAFRYRVGKSRHGQLADVLDPSIEYDEWREMGACTKPDVEVLFMIAQDDGEIAADDPRIQRVVCRLGQGAVGQRLYLRAIGSARIEVSAGPPGGEPTKGAPSWQVDLKTAHAEPRGS